MRSIRKFIFVFVAILEFGICSAQSPDGTLGNWTMIFNQTRLSQKWGLQSDLQFRSYQVKANAEQLLLRAGLNHYISNNLVATVGYAYVSNYAFDKDSLPDALIQENRIWQQVAFKNTFGLLYLDYRLRLEQRWLESKNKGRYLNRARIMVRATLPLNAKKLLPKTFFVSMYDEVFLAIDPNRFDRNRLFLSLGYQLKANLNLQIGWLQQTVNINSTNNTKPYLQTAIFYNMDFRK